METPVSGYTLVEIAAAMAIGLIVLGTIGATFAVQEALYRDQTETIRVLESLRVGMEVMSREILGAGGNGVPAIKAARADVLEIHVPGQKDPVVFRWQNQKLTRCAQPLVEHVPEFGLCFTYFDENGMPIDPPIAGDDLSRIRRIAVSLTVCAGQSPGDRPCRSKTLSTSVAIRNPAAVRESGE